MPAYSETVAPSLPYYMLSVFHFVSPDCFSAAHAGIEFLARSTQPLDYSRLPFIMALMSP